MKRARAIILTVMVILSFNFLCSLSWSAGEENAEIEVSLNVIRVIFTMDPGREEYKDGIPHPVFFYDPRAIIKQKLVDAGFEVVAEDSEEYDLTLRILHRERARATGSYPGDIFYSPGGTSSKMMIDSLEFTLEDGDSNVLLTEVRGPFGTYDNMSVVRDSIAEEVPILIKLRLEAEDEVSYIIARLEQMGVERHLLKRLSTLADPKAIEGLRPFLRDCWGPMRWEVKYTLMDLGYEPLSTRENAAFDMVDLVSPFWRRPSSSRPEKVNPKTIIALYGLTAIELFLEDLKCDVNKGKIDEAATSENAKVALCMLTEVNWAKQWGQGKVYLDKFKIDKIEYLDQEEVKARLGISDKKDFFDRKNVIKLYDQAWNTYAVTQLINALNEENEDVEDKDRYLKNIIDILGEIANAQAIGPLENYLAYPELAEYVEKAIEAIESRK
jgi:hypothetical protein